mmetsp:Transcript_10204/g.41558  ORF Transcript_10204/g.41558 Transcript_10204/m.41558 type:complete len:374 (-) Transcript_10204:2413-3534(-)
MPAVCLHRCAGASLLVILAALLGASIPRTAASFPITKGYAISPVGFPASYDNLLEFFEEVGSYDNSSVYANVAWRDNVTTSGQIPTAMQLVQQECNCPIGSRARCSAVVEFGWRSGSHLLLNVPGNPVNNWSNQKAADLYIKAVVDYVTAYPGERSKFVFLGNEINSYWQQNSTDYENWVAVYGRAYDAVKEANPATLVGTIFNYESLAGQGHLNDWVAPMWPSLTALDFDKVDILGLTSYPFFDMKNGADMPPDFYQPLYDILYNSTNAVTQGPNHLYPTAFTETGWPEEQLTAFSFLWSESTEDADAFAAALFETTPVAGGVTPLVQWLFLNQESPAGGANTTSTYAEFGSISLKDAEGNPYPALDTWLAG